MFYTRKGPRLILIGINRRAEKQPAPGVGGEGL
jgi:hypothetical protein